MNKLSSINLNLTLRLDFNSKLREDEFEFFLRQLPDPILEKIEYIEDPTPMVAKWIEWNQKISLAYDFQQSEYEPEFAKFKIIKPSRENIDKKHNFFTLTSAMDHPVGLAHGLRQAQEFAQNTSGFLTLDLYQKTEFNKFFVQIENTLNFSSLALNDFGIGMTKELSELHWRPRSEVSL